MCGELAKQCLSSWFSKSYWRRKARNLTTCVWQLFLSVSSSPSLWISLNLYFQAIQSCTRSLLQPWIDSVVILGKICLKHGS
jgi:hypothetical protein